MELLYCLIIFILIYIIYHCPSEGFTVIGPHNELRDTGIMSFNDDGYTGVKHNEDFYTTIDDKLDNIVIKPKIRPYIAGTDYCCYEYSDQNVDDQTQSGALIYDESIYDF